jgi:hypothetical protein
MIAQAVAFDFPVGEISCPTRYFGDASSIGFRRSVVYGLGVVRTSLSFRLWKWGLAAPPIFSADPALRLPGDAEAELHPG